MIGIDIALALRTVFSLLAGSLIAVLDLATLRTNVRYYLCGHRWRGVMLHLGRLGAITTGLIIAARFQALIFVVTALGFLVVRSVLVRTARRAS